MILRSIPYLACLALFVAASAAGVDIAYGPVALPEDPAGGGSPTSVRVYWRTDVAATSVLVRVGDGPDGPWSHTVAGEADRVVHDVRVDGLDPDRVYTARVECDGALSDPVAFRTTENFLLNGSFETWHDVDAPWGDAEPDGWRGWEIFPWNPPGADNPDHISIARDRMTGVPTPAAQDGSHRASMDEGWRSCYGGLYQEVAGLVPGDYDVSCWIATLFQDTNPDLHRVSVIVRDGEHVPDVEPVGVEIFAADRGAELSWIAAQGTAACASGTLTVYCCLRSDDWDGQSFAHFDAVRLTGAVPPQPQPDTPFRLGMSMIGGSIPDGGDDVGPGNEVQLMIERDHPLVTISGLVRTSWRTAQPVDPGDGPNVYDWTDLDSGAGDLLPGKSLLSYYQMWGTSPDWVVEDTPRFWEKFEEFVEAMTLHINASYGPVYYTFENEPNISRAPDGWNWADWYVHCLQHFHAAVHRATAVTGADNRVIAGNLSGHSANGFDQLYARGLKGVSDLLGYHAYPYDIRDGVEVADLARIHEIQVAYDDAAKQIFVSEGWGSGRSAGFDRSSPWIEPTALEIEYMWLAMTKGWDNVMTPRPNWEPEYLFGMKFFCGNDNWGSMNWRKRAIPRKNDHGDITGFVVDGYSMTPDIAPYFWNGGMMDFYGNSKDCLGHVFPGDGLVFMNPGFELASEPPATHLPHFWTATEDPAPESTYGLDSPGHGGSRALRLTAVAGTPAQVSQLTVRRSVDPGPACLATAWVRGDSAASLTARFGIRFCSLDGSPISSIAWVDAAAPAEWRQLAVSAAAPLGASRIEAFCRGEGEGTAWFDDVTVSVAETPQTGRVQGYTLDEGQVVVPNCVVRTTSGGAQAVSDGTGFYAIDEVPSGTYDFVCRRQGYVPHRVRNQTVAPGGITFVNFNMGTPKPGLTLASVACDPQDLAAPHVPAAVTLVVDNTRPYPNRVSTAGIFVEEDGADVTDLFDVSPDPANPVVIPASSSAEFRFTLVPGPAAQGRSFSVNGFAAGQEDRPNMLENGGFDAEPWDEDWSFTGGAQSLGWSTDAEDVVSPPRSLHCTVADTGYTWNWANNYSAYGPGAVPAEPGRNYTVGVHHKDRTSAQGISINLFIQEYYYDGADWFYNGRRFIGVPHRDVWAHDVMIYETGDPAVNPGLYPTSRLVISCGPCTSPPGGSGETWWDDLYVKETGDWLADDRADTAASLTVAAPPGGEYLALE